jgi:hypothetical protein
VKPREGFLRQADPGGTPGDNRGTHPDPARGAPPRAATVVLIDPHGNFGQQSMLSLGLAPDIEVVGLAHEADRGFGMTLELSPEVVVLGWGEWGPLLLRLIACAAFARPTPGVIVVLNEAAHAETWPVIGAAGVMKLAELPRWLPAEIERVRARAALGRPGPLRGPPTPR